MKGLTAGLSKLPWNRAEEAPVGPQPVVPDRVEPALPALRAAVHASDRLAAALAREWRQVALVPGVRPRAELALVEVADGVEVPEGLELGDVPLVVWVTAARPTAAHAPLLARATHVFVALESQLAAWQAVAPSVRLLPPAASGRLLPSRPPLRHGFALVVDGPVAPEPAALMAAVAVPGLRPMIDEETGDPGLLRLARLDPATRIARVLARPTPEVTEPAGLDDLLGAVAVLADGPRRAPDDTWGLLAAAAAGTSVVGLGDLPVPDGLDVPTHTDPRTWRGDVVARLHQPELRDREGLLLTRAVRHRHSLTSRVATLADTLGLERPTPRRSVSAIVATNRPHELDTVLANVGRQVHPAVELVLVLHGFDVDQGELKDRAAAAGVTSLTVVEAAVELTLGACLNLGIDAAGGDYLAKLDDDNYYGAHYLTDLVDAFDATGAGVVGKWAHHVWLRGSGAVVLRYPDAENSYQRRIQGGSMVFDGDLLRRIRFSDLPRGVDSDVLDRALAEGVAVWSGDRFNYVSIREADTSGHTWTVAERTFMTATGRLLFHGDPRTHVEV